MTETKKELFTHKQLAEILVKQAGIHEGHWAVSIEFGLGGANMPVADPADPDGNFSLQPTALIPIRSIGIAKHDESSPLTVDAAKVNPDSEAESKEPTARKRKNSG